MFGSWDALGRLQAAAGGIHVFMTESTQSEAAPPRALHTAPTARAGRLYLAGALLLTAFAFGLRYQALWVGFAADDYAQLGMLNGDYLVHRSPFNLFSFSDGSLAEAKRLMHGGFYPWWTYQQVRLTMLRPLASAMMWLDWKAFGRDAFPYHVHSLLWWLLMLAMVARLFYRLLPVPVGLLAFAFFAVDEAHGMPLCWIANRNASVATALSVIALLAYLRYRERRTIRDAWIALITFTLALGVGEYALCVLGYFVAYALLVERGAMSDRLRGLWPALVPAGAFILTRSLLGFNPRDSGVYLDPLTSPGRFAVAIVQRLPALYADLMFGIRADWWTFGLPGMHELVDAGYLSKTWLWSNAPWRHAEIALGALALIAIAAIARATPRNAHTRNLGWLLAGAALASLPVVASFPSSRLLLATLLGFAPLLAAFVLASFSAIGERWRSKPVKTALSLAAAGLAGSFHLGVSAWQSHVEVMGLAGGIPAIRSAVLNMRVDARKLPEQHVVVLAALDGGSSQYIPLTRALHGRTVPLTCWTLSLTPSEHVITRDSERSFILAPLEGYTLPGSGDILRSEALPLHVGDSVDVGGMRVRVLALVNGQPKAIRVTFDVPLEDPSLLFVLPTGNGIRPFPLPAVGDTKIIPIPIVAP